MTLQPGWFGAALEQAKRERKDSLSRAAIHESGHLISNYRAGARNLEVNVALYDVVSRTRADVTGVDLVDVLVSYGAGRGALEVFGWPEPGRDTAHDAEQERQIANHLARGRRLDLEYRNAIIAAGREQAREIVRQNWTAVLALAQVLTKRYRLAGNELQAAISDALRPMSLPSPNRQPLLQAGNFGELQAFLAREHAFRREIDPRLRTLRRAPHKPPAPPTAVSGAPQRWRRTFAPPLGRSSSRAAERVDLIRGTAR